MLAEGRGNRLIDRHIQRCILRAGKAQHGRLHIGCSAGREGPGFLSRERRAIRAGNALFDRRCIKEARCQLRKWGEGGGVIHLVVADASGHINAARASQCEAGVGDGRRVHRHAEACQQTGVQRNVRRTVQRLRGEQGWSLRFGRNNAWI